MKYKDYYRTLGVNKNANEQEIKRAYRRLAREFHPDVNPDDPKAEEEFKKVVELKPDDCAAHYSLGNLYQERGLWDEALQEYEAALKAEPGRWEVIAEIEKIKQGK